MAEELSNQSKINTRLKISKQSILLDLPDTDASGKAVIVVDPETGEAGKAVVSLTGGSGGIIEGGVVKVNRPGLPAATIYADTWSDFNKQYYTVAVRVSCALTLDNPNREFGASTAVRLRYSVTKGDAAIQAIVVNNVSQPTNILSGVVDTTTTANTSKTFSMLVTDTGDFDATASASVNFYHTSFAFKSSVNLLTADAATISAAIVNLPSELPATKSYDRTFNLQDEYIYFAYPVTLGEASFIVGGLPNTAYSYIDFTYTNSFGYSHPYRLYRSGGKGTGSVNVKAN